jgi:phospholipase A1
LRFPGDILHHDKKEEKMRITNVISGTAALALLFFVSASGAEVTDPGTGINECAAIADETERLKCFDELSRRGVEESLAGPEEDTGKTAEKKAPSYLSRLWELDKESRRKDFPIKLHRSNYILPLTYNRTPNEEPVQAADPDKEVKKYEVKFQISFKIKLWQDIFDKNMDLWVGYTQLSFWQLYNTEDSSPFRETDYEPELLLNFRTDYPFLGLRGRFVNIGFNHQSNGQSEPLSRSWNRIVANFGFERDNFIFILNTWYRIPESEDDDDNPNIEDYLGYGQVNLFYIWRGHRFGLFLRNNLDFHDNNGAIQLEWSIPLLKNVGGYIQYFYGYGESLLDYKASTNRIGVGFIVKNW